MKLSVIIPVYNEVKTINEIIKKVLEVNVEYKEIIIVDDHSNDGTNKIIEKFKENNLIKIIRHEKNMGKGAAIITAIPLLTGDYVIIQDADLEYDPEDYVKFMNLININKDIKVLYGSRVLGRKKMEKKFAVVFRIFANFILTKLSNFLNRQKLTDAHTCYKFMDINTIKILKLSHRDFSICPEITTKLGRLNYNITEIPIGYNGRSYSDGKKIKFKDAILALYTLVKFKFFWQNKN
tara:strand:+ start:5585 stop:6295 length:711 start_codon:yes stop_codon:yes gene_type:complete